MEPRKIALITRTRTQNQGNQALSVAWRNVLRRAFPSAEVAMLERVPGFLKRYTAAHFSRQQNPARAFDRAMHKLLGECPMTWTADPSTADALYQQSGVPRFATLRETLRLRTRLARVGVGKQAYLNRLAYLVDSDLVVVNPAGEFKNDSSDTALQYLIETRLAQLAGVRTAFVNVTFEIEDSTVLLLACHVLDQCDILEFRDQQSAEYYQEVGGQKPPIVLPDAATLCGVTRSPNPPEVSPRSVALSVNAIQAKKRGTEQDWLELVASLQASYRVVLVSNEWVSDFPLWEQLPATDQQHEASQMQFTDYANSLSQYGVVVSSRLHTCVLAMLAGVPVVPVETDTTKLSGFFNEIGLPDYAIRTNGQEWRSQVTTRIQEAVEDRDHVVEVQDDRVEQAQERIEQNLMDAFHSL